MDPRVDRTREHVLTTAQELLAERGAAALTFSSLAERARVSRNTLYRHWPSRDALLADVLTRNHLAEPPLPEGDAGEVVDAFLRGMLETLAVEGTVATITEVIAAAEHDAGADEALRRVHETRIATLRERVRDLTEEDLALIAGPIFFQRLIARGPISDELLARIRATVAHERRERRD